jgi:hypothetical protein
VAEASKGGRVGCGEAHSDREQVVLELCVNDTVVQCSITYGMMWGFYQKQSGSPMDFSFHSLTLHIGALILG